MAKMPYVLAHTADQPFHTRTTLAPVGVPLEQGFVVDNISFERSKQIRFSAKASSLFQALGQGSKAAFHKDDWLYLVEPHQKIAFFLSSVTWAPPNWPGLREWSLKCSGHEHDLLVFFDWLLERAPDIQHEPFRFSVSGDLAHYKNAGVLHSFTKSATSSLYDAFGEAFVASEEPEVTEYSFVALENGKQGFTIRIEASSVRFGVFPLLVTKSVYLPDLQRFLAWFRERLALVKTNVQFRHSVRPLPDK